MLRHNCCFCSENKSVSMWVFKENNAEASPLAKEKRLEQVPKEKPGKVKPRGRKISHGSNLRRSKTRCDVKSVVLWL